MKASPIILLFFCVSLNMACAQDLTFKQRTQITAGLTTTDAPNLGVRYRIGQTLLWCNVGIGTLGRGRYFLTVGPSVTRHLWGTSKKTDLKPWYVKLGLTGVTYALPLTPRDTESARLIYAKVQLGRDFNFTRRVGTTFSIGPSARVYLKWNRPDRTSNIDLINYASFDMNIFYRLQKIS
jgi:hypothetical protein